MSGADLERRSGARGYSWPPLQPGHELSTKHGAYSSPVRLAPRVEEISAALRAASPLGDRAEFSAAFASASLILARLERASAHLHEAVEDRDEERHARLEKNCRSWINSLAGWLDRLGLTPRAAAELGYLGAASAAERAAAQVLSVDRPATTLADVARLARELGISLEEDAEVVDAEVEEDGDDGEGAPGGESDPG